MATNYTYEKDCMVRFGSFEVFAHDALGLTDGDILRFRELYLR